MKWSHFFKNLIQVYILKTLKQQFTYTIKLSQIDSSPDKAHNNPQIFFFLTPLQCIELLNFLRLKKNPRNENGHTLATSKLLCKENAGAILNPLLISNE